MPGDPPGDQHPQQREVAAAAEEPVRGLMLPQHPILHESMNAYHHWALFGRYPIKTPRARDQDAKHGKGPSGANSGKAADSAPSLDTAEAASAEALALEEAPDAVEVAPMIESAPSGQEAFNPMPLPEKERRAVDFRNKVRGDNPPPFPLPGVSAQAREYPDPPPRIRLMGLSKCLHALNTPRTPHVDRCTWPL
jgi:hypothetical protein